MLDHMIFNKLKWFNIADNADSVTANGKNYSAVPKKITIKQGTMIFSDSLKFGSAIGDDSVNVFVNNDCEVDCVGASGDYYFFTGDVPAKSFASLVGSNNPSYFTFAMPNENNYGSYSVHYPGYVRKSDVKNVIWGGKKLLHTIASMAKRAFTQFRKGAETC